MSRIFLKSIKNNILSTGFQGIGSRRFAIIYVIKMTETLSRFMEY